MKGEKILIVEDERIIAIDLQRRLERYGYTVVAISATADHAIDMVERHSPDIILMDIHIIGDIDGIETAKIIKSRYAIPVIFLTAFSNQEIIERAKIAEPSGYILKPFKDKELYTTIDIALYKYRVDQELKKQQRWSTAILHSIADGIIATDKENSIILINPVAEKITGWEEKDVIGKSLNEIILLEDMNQSDSPVVNLPESDEMIVRRRPFTFKNCYLSNNHGEKLQVEGSLAAIMDKPGNFEGLVLAIRDMTTVKKLSEAIAYHTSHDNLTGLSNRDSFSLKLESLLTESESMEEENALLFIDMDRFKIINDTCGHTTADTMLVNVANIIKDHSETSEHSARLGGDQFGLILNGSDRDDIVAKATKLHNQFHTLRLEWEEKVFPYDTSIGIAFLEGTEKSVSVLLAEVDDACFVAKEEGGNRIKIYNEMENQFQKRRGEMEWVSKLSRALDKNRFELYIQEIRPLNSSADTPSKGEILIRMRNEEGQIVMPADFIPAAERYNMMAQIDRWVISESIRLFRENMKHGRLKHIQQFSVNLSAQSMTDNSILGFIKEQFRDAGISPEHFCFEITETATISNMASAHEFINDLKQTGCSFALDDFGSGFSSFNYLKNLPVDYLKIDGVFVRNMHEDSVNKAMVEAINTMGHIMGKKTIAEFVSNSTIINMLSELKVDYAQGYEISKPIPLESKNWA